ncbi:hypothetical protein [Microvirga roseola]|uniref:hypothetical protein n=1 Tax=Microvirga roseola TaxID=2883126 RepID=UPI001E434C05|nr:hypothetical protein [Microvirga roseola]
MQDALDRRRAGLPASLVLHALLMLAFLASLRPKPFPPLPESVPVEVWTEE